MANRPTRTILIALIALVAPACQKPHEPAAPVEVETSAWNFRGVMGKELVTDHYRVRTTCTYPPLLTRLPVFLESCWTEYEKLVPPANDPSEPALTYLFQTRQQWEIFTKSFSPARAPTYLLIRSGGYEERGVTVSHYGRMATTLSVMAHEGLHQYLSLTRGGALPAWVNEGLACYFEAFDLDEDGRPTFTPRNNYIRRNSLRDAFLKQQMFDLPELLSTNAGRVVAMPTMKVRTYYAQTWSVVLMLLEEDPKTSPEGAGFRRLLSDLGRDEMKQAVQASAGDGGRPMEPGERVFRAYVTEDLESFKQQYDGYVRKLLDVR
jgi:hypothetical protein